MPVSLLIITERDLNSLYYLLTVSLITIWSGGAMTFKYQLHGRQAAISFEARPRAPPPPPPSPPRLREMNEGTQMRATCHLFYMRAQEQAQLYGVIDHQVWTVQ